MIQAYLTNVIKYKLLDYILLSPIAVSELSKMSSDCFKDYLIWCYYCSEVNNILVLNQENKEIITQTILEIFNS
jgi:hypothetical protein